MPTGIYDRTKSKWKPWSKGKKFSKTHKRNLSKSHKGTHPSEETKIKMSNSQKGRIPWNKGKKNCFSKATIRKMSITRKGMLKGNKNPQWEGGEFVDGTGYVQIYKPEHPAAKRNYVRRSHLIMEKHIGRYLKPKEVTHHINRIRNDDRIKNLKLFKNHSKHMNCEHHHR